MSMVIRIGTRASQLALAQTQWVIDRISAHYPNITVDLVRIKTKGDKIIDRPLSDIGGKGLFIKEIEEALQRKEIDVAVHSLKDVPAELPDDLYIGVIPERENPYDVLISRDNIALKDLPEGSFIGTSSLRRAAQLLHCRADLNITPLRGNLDTRLRKLDTANIQAIIVAAAGLKRMGLGDKITQYFSADIMLPAIGQGALGLELRRDDEKTRDMLAFLDHYPTRAAVKAERSFLVELGGGCELPVAALAQFDDESIHLDALVANLDGSRIFRDAIVGTADKEGELGTNLARRLVDAGAQQILDEIYGSL
ncbi:MAG: hydroxymethylbilane synthase [Deltaproteobacteria bacterium]|nr:MAG: hydroxymethylbilane synthase [Deltaproteobacteria bacterium]